MNRKPTYEELEQTVKELEREVSALRRAEADGRLMRDKFESMLAAIGDGVAITTYDYRVIYANDALKKITGGNELEGHLCYKIFLDRDAPCASCLMRRAIESGRTETNRLLQPQTRVIELTASPLRLPSGEMAAIEIARDVTPGPKQAEEALGETERKYRSLVDLSPDPVVILQDGCCQLVSPAFTELFGYSKVEVDNGLSFFQLVPEHHKDAVRQRYEDRLSGKRLPKTYYIELIAKDGTLIPCETSAALIEFKGRPAVLVVIRDITERKQAEARLRESEETLKTIFESATDGILIADLQTKRFVSGNAMICQMLGCSREEITNLAVSDIHPSEDLPRVLDQIEKQARGEITLAAEIPLKRKDGSVFYADINASTITFSGRLCLMGIFRDITQRKKMEKERLRAQKLESVGVLAGGIAHDFNNLLTGIMGNISLAKLCAKRGDKVFARLSNAEKACLQAKGLSQQLLTFSKGGKPVKKTASITKLIKDSVSFASRGSDVRCALSIADDLWAVEVDEGQIGQVISNLVINACQAMPSGGLFEVKAENTIVHDRLDVPLPEGGYVHIRVEDHGAGIPSKHLPKIFDPYFTTKQSGSGLGLATVYSIIKSHDGYVTVDSEPGIGTTFHVYLPASSKAALLTQTVEEDPADIFPTKGKVLVLDDQAIVREIAGEILAYIGYEVEYASDGVETIELYQKAKEAGRPFDAIIMDLTILTIPGGKEALRRLFEIDPGVKAVVSSGYSNDPIMSEYRRYGFSGVIAKPYCVEELSKVLYDVIGKQ